MANEKILILEAPWSFTIADTSATREIYSSAETLLSIHPEPVRIIQRPLVSTTYLDDIKQFVSLECNKRGPNIVVLSSHGCHTLVLRGNAKKHRRELRGFDDSINISVEIRRLTDSLKRTIFILDACEVGENISSFREAAGAAGAVGFSETVDWIDSSVFVLALLLKFQSSGVFHMKRARTSTGVTTPKAEKVVQEMKLGPYKSLMKSLSVQYSFGT